MEKTKSVKILAAVLVVFVATGGIFFAKNVGALNVAPASGTWGTAVWILDAAGNLNISGGTMGANSVAAGDPMLTQAENISTVKITGQLTALNKDSSSRLFTKLQNLTRISGVDKIVLSDGCNMDGTFAENRLLTTIDGIGELDVSSCENFHQTFTSDPSLLSLDLSGWNTSSATSMRFMFGGDYNLAELNIANFNTEKVQDFTGMFKGDLSLTTLDLSSFAKNPSAATDYMLALNDTDTRAPVSLRQLTLGNFALNSNMGLSDISTFRDFSSDNYTGFWQNIGSGTTENPAGKSVVKSSDLMKNYIGENGELSVGTYVWQPVAKSTSPAAPAPNPTISNPTTPNIPKAPNTGFSRKTSNIFPLAATGFIVAILYFVRRLFAKKSRK